MFFAENVVVKQVLDTAVIERDGEEYLDIRNIKLDLTLSKLSINFANIVRDENIDEAINKVINDNWKDIYYELKPDMEKNMADVIRTLVKPLFDNIPYRSFFLPEQ